MRGKFGILVTSLGSIFGVSVKNHIFSWASSKKPKIHEKERTYFKAVADSLERSDFSQSELLLTSSRPKANSSLDKHLFGNMQYESEGSNSPLFLVTKDNKVIKIDPSLYGQKSRRLVDGILIDKNNKWFGPRNENVDQITAETIKKVELYKDFFRKMNKPELEMMQNWWDKKSDREMCESLELLETCDNLKNLLKNGYSRRQKEMKDLVKLKLVKIAELNQDTTRIIPELKNVIGREKVINLPEISSHIGYWIGGPIDKWLDDYLQKKADIKDNEEINPFKLLEKFLKGEEVSFTCEKVKSESGQKEKNGTNGDNQKIYSECLSNQLKYSDSSESEEQLESFGKEEQTTPKVLEVIKAGKREGVSTVRFSKAPEGGSSKTYLTNGNNNNWNKQGELKSKTEIINKWKDKGRNDNLIDIECQKYWSKLWFGFAFQGSESQGCQLIWNDLIFRGNISDKRWCLFEIPGAQKYIREYEFKFLSTFNWYEGNKFWAKCSNYSI
ncbi:hypothetical protein [Mycoplasma suis]|uniref:Uncharacterized protein n=1 Tax=Mycoplasma suis (strain Illinois) TaxID=768700 RepID=F0QRX5_MYCSL|nr:hypothetical protein [Mycoplasma suis]ADX98245.1 hypothetical protein MSU_0714 [Mycoplasma suis str. Illinois]